MSKFVRARNYEYSTVSTVSLFLRFNVFYSLWVTLCHTVFNIWVMAHTHIIYGIFISPSPFMLVTDSRVTWWLQFALRHWHIAKFKQKFQDWNGTGSHTNRNGEPLQKRAESLMQPRSSVTFTSTRFQMCFLSHSWALSMENGAFRMSRGDINRKKPLNLSLFRGHVS